VTAKLRTLAKVEQAVTAQSTIHPDGTYIVPPTIDIDGLFHMPSKIWLFKKTQHKCEVLHFGYVAHWEAFRVVLISKKLFAHDDTLLPRQLFFSASFTVVDSGFVWMFIKGYINHLCGETLTGLRMGVLVPTTNFASPEVTLTETQRLVVINAPSQSRQDHVD
jgi:hypothetical protein